MKSICAVEGCDRPTRTRGWCAMHYTRVLKHGDPTRNDRVKPKRQCIVEGCEGIGRYVSMCSKHHQRVRKYGTPDGKPASTITERPGEEWRPVVGWEGSYVVSSEGRIASVDREVAGPNGCKRRVRGRILKQKLNPVTGYKFIALSDYPRLKNPTVHRVVSDAFLGALPSGMDVCHNDGDRMNNRVVNLRIDTRAGNMQDSIRHGTNAQMNLTHCKRGHVLDHPNLVLARLESEGYRRCLACTRARQKRSYDGDRLALADRMYEQIMAEGAA